MCGHAFYCVPECQLWARPPGGTREWELRKGSTIPRERPPRGAKAHEEGDQKQDRAVLAPRGSFLERLGTVPVLKPAFTQHGACGHCCQPLAPPPTKRIFFFFFTNRNKQTNKRKEDARHSCDTQKPGPRGSRTDAPTRATTRARGASNPQPPENVRSHRSLDRRGFHTTVWEWR